MKLTLGPAAPRWILTPKRTAAIRMNFARGSTWRAFVHSVTILLLQVHVMTAATAEAVLVLDVCYLNPGTAVVPSHLALAHVLPVIAASGCQADELFLTGMIRALTTRNECAF